MKKRTLVKLIATMLVVAMMSSVCMVQAFAEQSIAPRATSSQSVNEYWNGYYFTSNVTYNSSTRKFTCTTTWGLSAGIYAKIQPYFLNSQNAAQPSPPVEYETLGYSASASQGPYYTNYLAPYYASGTSRVSYNGQTKTGSSRLNFYA